MPQILQIKATLLDLKSKLDKNSNPYWRLSLIGSPRYFYAFSNSLNPESFTTLTDSSHNLLNQQVLITYQEFPNQDGNGTFFKVKEIELV